jgi:hypothetical protein
MSFADLLFQICDVKRHTQTDTKTDAYGQPIYTWKVIEDDIPCRLVDAKGKEVKKGAEVVILNYKLFLEAGVDITEQDLVEIDSEDYEVKLVQSIKDSSAEHHVEVYLEKVK